MATCNISRSPAYNTWGGVCFGLGLLLGLGSWSTLRLCLCFGLCCPSPSRWLARRCTCGCIPLPAPALSTLSFSLLAFNCCINLSLSLAFSLAFSLALSPAFSLTFCWAPSSATAPALVGLIRLFVLLWLWISAPSEARQATGDPLVFQKYNQELALMSAQVLRWVSISIELWGCPAGGQCSEVGYH